MSTAGLVTTEQQMSGPLHDDGSSLVTQLGLVEGDILTYLERHGATTLRHLIRSLTWRTPLIIMATGALIRGGLVRATQRELEVILEPSARVAAAGAVADERAPKVWGG